MSRSNCFRVVLLTCCLVLGAVAYHGTTEDLMVETANAWLASLNSNQITSAQYKLDNPDYETWHFVPDNSFVSARGYRRNGLTYKEMTPEQGALADALLAASVSRIGFVSVKTIMSLEEGPANQGTGHGRKTRRERLPLQRVRQAGDGRRLGLAP